MIVGSELVVERRRTLSPIWLRAVDEFAGQRVTGELTVVLDRAADGGWEPVPARATRTAGGDVAFLGLGRARGPSVGALRRFRVRLDAPGLAPVYPGPDGGVVVTVALWDPDRPPTSLALLVEVPMLPAATYPFPSGTPLLDGNTVDAGGSPVVDAEVAATAAGRRERVRSGPRGAFRLPLRFAIGVTRVTATAGALAGHVDVNVPRDLSTTPSLVLT